VGANEPTAIVKIQSSANAHRSDWSRHPESHRAARAQKVQVVPKEYVAESVVRSLKNRVKGKRVLLVRAKVARDVIPRELHKAGAPC